MHPQEYPFISVLYASCAEDTFRFSWKEPKMRDVKVAIRVMAVGVLAVANIAPSPKPPRSYFSAWAV